MWETLAEPFRFPFMTHALLAAALLAVPMALLSCLVVLKGWSLMGDAVSHAVLPGIVIAYVLGLPFAVGAFAAGLLCAVATGFVKENSRIPYDTVMGVVYAGMFGLGLVMYVNIDTDVHLQHILFGDILGISKADIAQTAVIAAVVSVVMALKWKDFLLHSFDPVHARVLGLRTSLIYYGLLSLLALTIVGALQAVGLILAIALLIAPGAVAFLMARTFRGMLCLAVIVSVSASLGGVYLSFFINGAPAPIIVLLMTAMFMAVLVVSSRRIRRAEAAVYPPASTSS
jgi:manganese/iron transport system permease protein